MVRPPCVKNGVHCTRRKPGCQDHCKDMAPFLKQQELIRERRAEEMKKDAYRADAVARMRKHNK